MTNSGPVRRAADEVMAMSAQFPLGEPPAGFSRLAQRVAKSLF
jgi:hypothetical protein